jgi:hypothetical protein
MSVKNTVIQNSLSISALLCFEKIRAPLAAFRLRWDNEGMMTEKILKKQSEPDSHTAKHN